MMKIYKYEISGYGVVKLEVPLGSNLLKVANQYEKLVAWFEVNTDIEEKETIEFHKVMTGNKLPVEPFEYSQPKYVDTVLFSNDGFVVHVYARRI